MSSPDTRLGRARSVKLDDRKIYGNIMANHRERPKP